MLYTRMHEHVGNKLIDLKVGSHKEMKTEHVVQVYSHAALDNVHRDKCQGIDDQKILCYIWKISHISLKFAYTIDLGAKLLKISVIIHKKKVIKRKIQIIYHFF